MSKDFQFLNEKLAEFQISLQDLEREIKKNGIQLLLKQGNQQAVAQFKDECKTTSEQIQHKFKVGKYQANENMKVSKLSKDFEKLVRKYQDLIDKIKENKVQQAIEIERNYSEASSRRQTIIEEQEKRRQSRIDTQDDDLDESYLKEINSINPELEHYHMLIQEKNSEIQQIQDEALQVYQIMVDVSKLANDQGLQLDIAETNINISNKNVKSTVGELQEAKVQHGQYKKKMLIAFGIGIVAVAVIVLPIVI